MPRNAGSCVIRHHLFEQLPIQAERASLLRRDRTAKLSLQLLELIAVGLPELLSRYLGVADGRNGSAPAAPEYVADTPDCEGEDQDADDGPHDGFAEPTIGRFAQTSEHCVTGLKRLRKRPQPQRHHRDAPCAQQLCRICGTSHDLNELARRLA
jgi:hypothetical protein